MATKKINFDIESREGEEDRTTISINGIGEVVLVETFPEYEFLEDVGEDGLEELNVEEGDLIGKIEHLEIEDEYKGQGYAKILMNKAIELAKEKGLMPLYLNASPMGSKRYGLDVDDLTGFYESLGFEVFLRQGGNNLMILKDTYKTGGETKNKIMAKQIKIQFEDNYADGGVTYSEWSKDDFWQEQFQEWMEDGNVTKNADGTYSTQDAQYTNSLKGISGLKKYFYNEFIKGQYADGGKAVKKYVVVGEVYDGGEVWKETFDNLDEALDLAREIQNGWTDDGTYYLITIYNETGKKVAEISDDKYFNELTENKLFKKFDLSADTKKTRQIENEKLNGYKFKLEVRIADGGATRIFEKTFDSIFDVMDKMNTYYEEDYYALINGKDLDYWEEQYSEINASRNFIKGKYGWSFIKEGNLWIAKDDYDNNYIVRLVNGKNTSDSSISKGALKQIIELEAQKKYSEKPKHNNSLSDMKKIWDKLSKNYNEREDIAFLVGYYGGLLSDIVPKKWDDIDKGTQIDIMNAYFGQTEEQKQKRINEYRKRHEALVKEHKTLRNLYGINKREFKLFGIKIFEQGGSLDNKHLIAKAIEYVTGYAVDTDTIQDEANNYSFKYKGRNVWSTLNSKLVNDTIRMHRKSLESRYAEGGSVGKGYNVFNYTDNIYATDEVFKTKKLANDFIREFRNRFSKQGYYRDNQMNKIAVEDIDLLAIPSDFNPFGKYEDGGRTMENRAKKQARKDIKTHLYRPQAPYQSVEKPSEEWERYELPYDTKMQYDFEPDSFSAENKRYSEYAKGGEAGFDNEGTSMVLYHEKNGNWLVPKGQVYLYLYDVENSGSKLGKEFDWVFYPLTAPIMAWQSGYIPPLKKIWTKKFQKDHKGSEHLLGVIKSYLIEEDGKKELFIDMMSVNPTKKKKGIMSYMIKELRESFNLSQDQVTFSDLTDEGKKFVEKKTYADGGETSGLITDEQVKDLSFKIKIKNVPLQKGVLLHEIVTLEEFDLGDEKNINFYPFHLIYGDSSLAIFDAFGVDEVAGLKRKDCEEFINNLKAQGKTEKDGSFMAGLTNYVGDKLFMFFNVARLSYEGFANRVLPHEALHLSRSLISLYKNDWVRENLNTPKWWEDKRAVFVDMGDSNEEFFAETLERTTAIAMDGWYRVTGQKCVVEKNKTYADGGSADEEMNFFVVIDSDDKNYNRVGYSLGETIIDKEGNEFEKLYFENKKIPKKYSVNDISYLNDRGEFSKKNKITGTTNFVILVDYQEKEPYFYIYNLTEKFVATEGYNWSSIIKSAGIENSIYAHQIFDGGGDI